ncbi:UxaA family hydrolase [Verrucomicrobiaceae bacterium N1E253]|uniref:UxaA family hydrolase n=1 Tax=Oceaniferula marina TaxID=2748318 RepID=A0A851G8Y5_9BACT|nr:UxaA family hydrolase [Oceaniferula marina]NWK54178.1 UxaA family hydrolase [Oceaniferula marina]
MMATPLEEIARFPIVGDNAAIALKDLKQGTCIQNGEDVLELQHDVLTGHRFASEAIPRGSYITSWHYPFGKAACDIEAGEYLCNEHVLFRLSLQEDTRFTALKLPAEANFTDDIDAYSFDAGAWEAPAAVDEYQNSGSFMGYNRGARGTGTRNHLVILGTSATNAPLVEKLEHAFKDGIEGYEHVDAVVGLRHTEGAETNSVERERTLRTLSGLISNPNVGAVLSIESGLEGELTNEELEQWMRADGIPVDDMDIVWMKSHETFTRNLAAASKHVKSLLKQLNAHQRSERPLSELRIGLQCGASDAFSGVCGNVLSGSIAREVIRYGGSANLTETPELSGAEDYTLSSITEPEIAPRFLSMMSRFKEQLGWHGGKVDKNPSEGNLLGGLYNITLKSLGAAVKRDPDIPIRHLIEYSERMTQPGFYFMDGMGGDIASYTGQAAAACNIILFVTGRGTPTNSSIVPTVKIVNTTERYKLMADDIDINAGQYLDGKSMESLTSEAMDQVISIASGQKTLGEKRNQNIDLLWRQKYFQSSPDQKAESYASRFDGAPVACDLSSYKPIEIVFDGIQGPDRVMPKERIGLIIPTVGCSVATSEQAVAKLNSGPLVQKGAIDRFVTLTNTEGCGTTTGAEVLNFILSYAKHDMVDACAFVSLGCEMVSPGFIKSAMRGGDVSFPEISSSAIVAGYNPEDYGWLTIQECGGTEGTVDSVANWFEKKLADRKEPIPAKGSGRDLRIGLTSTGPLSDESAQRLAEFAASVLAAGGTVIIPAHCSLVQNPTFQEALSVHQAAPSLTFAQVPETRGLHIMQSITENPIETVTGLGAATDVIAHYSDDVASPAHSLVPTLNISKDKVNDDFDAELSEDLASLIAEVLSNDYQPKQNHLANSGNQIPRGPRAHAI